MTWDTYRSVILRGAYLASGGDVFNEKLEVDQSLKMTPQQYHEVLKSFIQFRRGLISLGLLNDELVRVQVFVPGGVVLTYKSREVDLEDVVSYRELQQD